MKSSKFKEMLVKDLKKKDMELTDVDADTLPKNYNLLCLEQTCLVYLIENIEVSNACNILKFGDEHDVDEVKTLAKDFITDNASEIIHSHDWKEFATDNIKLALETIQEVYLKQTEKQN
ncbi:hypothetical protein CEXT_49881 [Caerostris extrusa]|uniref:Uncharacterized protein n=1 Tax=Caerostris extrusa TaxID=172846 RepID=A0AAV4UL05_CAEEX|nr:hypothetical protein CEXT_49881 [Caerostris extrusa]